MKQSVNNTIKRKRELARCSLHELRPWQAHHVETNNFEAHADMIHSPHTDFGHPTFHRVPIPVEGCGYTHPESIYRCIVFDMS